MKQQKETSTRVQLMILKIINRFRVEIRILCRNNSKLNFCTINFRDFYMTNSAKNGIDIDDWSKPINTRGGI